MPVSDDFQPIKDSYLISLLFWCYAMFKFCPSAHNVPNGQHKTPNICKTMTCRPIDMIAALENSSILFISTCKVLINSNTIQRYRLRRCLLQGHLKCLWNLVMYVTSFSSRAANSCSTSQTPKYYMPYIYIYIYIYSSIAHVADYAHMSTKYTSPDRYFDDTCT